VLRRLRGELAEPSTEQDWPPVAASDEAAWKAALVALRETHDELNRAIAGLDDAALERVEAGGRRSYYVLAHGAVHHALYHAGQIAILRKG
jgi:hypothetical protein